jgi:DNA-binding GntR family transcriptional regulator
LALGGKSSQPARELNTARLLIFRAFRRLFRLLYCMALADTNTDEGLNTTVYAELRKRLVTGFMPPGCELSTRGLASEMGVSQTPVRDALSRLAAEGAVAIRSKRRVRVPRMTQQRFDDLLRCRLLLEPEAAELALEHLSRTAIAQLREIDAALDAAILHGDAEAYMFNNHAFHFTIYRAQPGETLTQLIETLWLQFGPFMRLVYGRISSATLNDNHQAAIRAIEARDAKALRSAIAADISDGMGLLARTGFEADAAATLV